MIIVAGYVRTGPGQRDAFVAGSLAAVGAARQAEGCLDFAVSADPLDSDRVNVYQAWASSDNFEAFQADQADAPGEDLFALIVTASVEQYTVCEPPG